MNLNKLYQYFDTILILEASIKNQSPRTLVHFQKDFNCRINPPIPEYFFIQCPEFLEAINSN
jgi:hypothetical protein